MIILRKVISLFLVSLLVAACSGKPINEQNIPPISKAERNLINLAGAASGKSTGNSQSEKLYKQAIALSKGQIVAHTSLAKLYDASGKPEKAIVVLQDAKKLQPTNLLVNQMLGKYYIGVGDGKSALSYFADGLKRDKYQIDLLNGKAVSLDLMNEYESAQKTYQTAINLASARLVEKDFLYNNMAMSKMMSGDYGSAIEMFKTIKNKDALMRQNLAMAYAMSGDKKNAKYWASKDLSRDAVKSNLKIYDNYKDNIDSLIFRDVVPKAKPKSGE